MHFLLLPSAATNSICKYACMCAFLFIFYFKFFACVRVHGEGLIYVVFFFFWKFPPPFFLIFLTHFFLGQYTLRDCYCHEVALSVAKWKKKNKNNKNAQLQLVTAHSTRVNVFVHYKERKSESLLREKMWQCACPTLDGNYDSDLACNCGCACVCCRFNFTQWRKMRALQLWAASTPLTIATMLGLQLCTSMCVVPCGGGKYADDTRFHFQSTHTRLHWLSATGVGVGVGVGVDVFFKLLCTNAFCCLVRAWQSRSRTVAVAHCDWLVRRVSIIRRPFAHCLC